MSLRDLKNLAPWQWESKVAQKKHAIGPKGIADFEQVARVLQIRTKGVDAAELKDKQFSNNKRRRSTKENDHPSSYATDVATEASADADLADLAAVTPLIPSKKQRSTEPESDPAGGRIGDNASDAAAITIFSASVPAATAADAAAGGATPAFAEKVSKGHVPAATAAALHTPGIAAVATPAPAAVANGSNLAGAKDPAAVASAASALAAVTPATVRRNSSGSSSDAGCRDGSRHDLSAPQPALKTIQTPGSSFKTPRGQGVKPRNAKASHTSVPAAANTAARTPGTAAGGPTPRNVLDQVFSPSPVPTPTPCARLGFKTPNSAVKTKPNGTAGLTIRTKAVDTAAAAAGPNHSSNSRIGMSGTHLPKPQFTPHMPPPAARRVSNGGAGFSLHPQQQTPAGSAAAAAAGCAATNSSRVLQSPMGAAATPLTRFKLPAVDDSDDSPREGTVAAHATPGVGTLQLQQASAHASPIHGLVTPNEQQNLQDMGVQAHAGSLPEPALLQLKCPVVAVAAIASGTAAPAGPISSSTCLPAKLRCKKAGFSSAVEDTDVLQADAAAAAAQQISSEQVQQQLDKKTADTVQCPPAHSTDAITAAEYATPVAKVGLKRRWCQNHAATVAAEAAAAAQAGPDSSAGRSPDSLAVARSADLLLAAAAAAADDDDADEQQPGGFFVDDDEPRADLEAAAAAALDFMHVDLEAAPAQEQQPAAAYQPSNTQPLHKHQLILQQGRASVKAAGKHQAVLDLSGDIAAANATASAGAQPSCGTSLLLPPAAQARLQLLQQREKPQQLPCHHTDQQQQQGIAVGGKAVQCSLQYMQLLQIQQLQLQQQQLAAAGVRIPHTPAAAQNRMTRTTHSGVVVQAAGLPRYAHTGATATAGSQIGAWNSRLLLLQAHQQQLLQQQRSRSASPAPAPGSAAAAAAQNPTPEPAPAQTTAPVGRPDSSKHKQQAPAASKPPAYPSAAAAAAGVSKPLSNATAIATTAAGQANASLATSNSLDVAPLSVPGTLSDDEAWRLAQSQPWVIELEAARAKQLLAHFVQAAAAAAAVGGST